MYGERSSMSVDPNPYESYLTSFLCTHSALLMCTPLTGRLTQLVLKFQAHKWHIKGPKSITVSEFTWKSFHLTQHCQCFSDRNINILRKWHSAVHHNPQISDRGNTIKYNASKHVRELWSCIGEDTRCQWPIEEQAMMQCECGSTLGSGLLLLSNSNNAFLTSITVNWSDPKSGSPFTRSGLGLDWNQESTAYVRSRDSAKASQITCDPEGDCSLNLISDG
jgi:hypothetical protein